MSKQLGINKPMDALAVDNGLDHWSCVSPLDADLWVRSDGKSTCHDYCWGDTLTQWLEDFDKHNPIGKDWQQLSDSYRVGFDLGSGDDKSVIFDISLLKQPALVQNPFKYPCDGALYFLNSTKHQVFPNCQDKRYADVLTTSHIGGVMIWNESGENLQGSDDFLIMFVWE